MIPPLFYMVVTYADGDSENMPVVITSDGRWHFKVPAGVNTVAGLSVRPGDLVSGLISVS